MGPGGARWSQEGAGMGLGGGGRGLVGMKVDSVMDTHFILVH